MGRSARCMRGYTQGVRATGHKTARGRALSFTGHINRSKCSIVAVSMYLIRQCLYKLFLTGLYSDATFDE